MPRPTAMSLQIDLAHDTPKLRARKRNILQKELDSLEWLRRNAKDMDEMSLSRIHWATMTLRWAMRIEVQSPSAAASDYIKSRMRVT